MWFWFPFWLRNNSFVSLSIWSIPCHSSSSLQVRREAVPSDTGVKVRQVPGAKDSGEQRPGACGEHPTFYDRHHPRGGHPPSCPRGSCAGHWSILTAVLSYCCIATLLPWQHGCWSKGGGTSLCVYLCTANHLVTMVARSNLYFTTSSPLINFTRIQFQVLCGNRCNNSRKPFPGKQLWWKMYSWTKLSYWSDHSLATHDDLRNSIPGIFYESKNC